MPNNGSTVPVAREIDRERVAMPDEWHQAALTVSFSGESGTTGHTVTYALRGLVGLPCELWTTAMRPTDGPMSVRVVGIEQDERDDTPLLSVHRVDAHGEPIGRRMSVRFTHIRALVVT